MQQSIGQRLRRRLRLARPRRQHDGVVGEERGLGVGGQRGANGWPVLSVGPDQTLEDRILVTLPRATGRDHHEHDKRDITFNLVDLATGTSVRVEDHFMQPHGDRK